jgi:hypothetical protein
MEKHTVAAKDSPAWLLFVWCSFLAAPTVTAIGIYHAPVDLWVRAFLFMGLLWSIAGALTLAKTIRDNVESQRTLDRYFDAKTERFLSEYELRKAER